MIVGTVKREDIVMGKEYTTIGGHIIKASSKYGNSGNLRYFAVCYINPEASRRITATDATVGTEKLFQFTNGQLHADGYSKNSDWSIHSLLDGRRVVYKNRIGAVLIRLRSSSYKIIKRGGGSHGIDTAITLVRPLSGQVYYTGGTYGTDYDIVSSEWEGGDSNGGSVAVTNNLSYNVNEVLLLL